jgi:predicted dehydrogenase
MMRALEIFQQHMVNPQPCPWRFNRPGWDKIDVLGQEGTPSISIRINDDWHSWKAIHLTGDNAKYGLLLGEMTHFVDLARLFMQSEAVRVVAMHNGILNHSVSIEFANQSIASIAMFSNGTFGYPKELLEAIGNGGIVICDHMLEVRTAGIEGAPAVEKFPFLNDRDPEVGKEGGLYGWLEKKRKACANAAEKGDPMLQFTAEANKGHAAMLEEFIREIRGERPPVSPIRDAVEVTRICLAAMKSAEEKRIVDVSEIS